MAAWTSSRPVKRAASAVRHTFIISKFECSNLLVVTALLRHSLALLLAHKLLLLAAETIYDVLDLVLLGVVTLRCSQRRRRLHRIGTLACRSLTHLTFLAWSFVNNNRENLLVKIFIGWLRCRFKSGLRSRLLLYHSACHVFQPARRLTHLNPTEIFPFLRQMFQKSLI